MLGLPLAFTVPWVLAALATLPVLYWLLRMTPPPPRRAVLPTLAIMRDLEKKEETPAHTPWWLLLLRLLLAAIIIMAMAGPLWNPDAESRSGRGPLLVVVDNSWSAAPDWKQRTERAEALIATAGAAGRPVSLRATADEAAEIVPGTSARALEQLRGLQPQPHSIDRTRHLPSLQAYVAAHATSEVVWITDRVSAAGDPDAISKAAEILGDRLTVIAGEKAAAIGLAGPQNTPDALVLRVIRADDGATDAGTLRAIDSRGRPLAEGRFLFAAGQRETQARIETPLEIRNDISRIDIVGQTSAGAVQLLDSRSKRRRVGVITGESLDTAQPLLSPAYFITRALSPFADVREPPRGTADPIRRMIEDGAGALVLADVGGISGQTLRQLTEFVENGGVLIRFASRRVAAPTDSLLPVKLRRSERVMGGALSWDTPRKLTSYPQTGPFEGLKPPGDVTVSQQILAEPDAQLPEKTWAALEDGTPLITGERRGKGVVALFHVTADTAWSSLPLSGAFVDTLRRLTGLASVGSDLDQATAAEAQRRDGVALAPLRQLDGFGAFRPPSALAEPVARTFAEPATVKHPPGFYGAPDAPLAVNTLGTQAELRPLALPGIMVRPLQARPALDLRPYVMTLAILLLLVDAIAALWLSGALARLRAGRGKAATAVALAAAVLLAVPLASGALAQQPAAPSPPPGPAQERPLSFRADDIEAALNTRLAFVITGDREQDEISRQGLVGLSRALSTRTALDPADPIGVDLGRDELSYYPLLYWPMVASRPVPPEAAIRRIEAYMKNGGTIIFDTRDALNNRGGNTVTPEAALMRRILGTIDVPDLEPIPKDHVVTKTFYILDSFVGRYAVGRSWIEVLQRSADQDRTRPAQAGDRVSPIIITSNDLAAAWAVDRMGQPRFPLVPGDARQRELAIRGGINIVMYAMTGNYKADQVHVPALLERLGQ
jgi:Domain of unknown function (DUF4159)/Aerotolerance regulator N-terminal